LIEPPPHLGIKDFRLATAVVNRKYRDRTVQSQQRVRRGDQAHKEPASRPDEPRDKRLGTMTARRRRGSPAVVAPAPGPARNVRCDTRIRADVVQPAVARSPTATALVVAELAIAFASKQSFGQLRSNAPLVANPIAGAGGVKRAKAIPVLNL
jgi:hypothetical protein